MANATCPKCGASFTWDDSRPGRPRKYCDGCRRVDTRRGRYVPRPPASGSCAECGESIGGSPLQKYCSSRCKWMARKRSDGIPCTACGEPTGWTRRSGKTDVTHKACSRQPCGTIAAYKRGCRCAACRDANATAMREYAESRKRRDGVSLYSQNRRSDGAHGHFIPRAERLGIYERDGWVCQLCGHPVDPTLHFNDRMAATLDHVEPQSMALIPDHSPSNLRLAHRACNSRRNNRAVKVDVPLGVRA